MKQGFRLLIWGLLVALPGLLSAQKSLTAAELEAKLSGSRWGLRQVRFGQDELPDVVQDYLANMRDTVFLEFHPDGTYRNNLESIAGEDTPQRGRWFLDAEGFLVLQKINPNGLEEWSPRFRADFPDGMLRLLEADLLSPDEATEYLLEAQPYRPLGTAY